MLSASMMTWLTPTISVGRADGTSTRHSFCRARAARHVAEVARSPAARATAPSIVARTIGGVAKRPVASMRRDRAVAEQQQHRDEIGEGRDRLHQIERRRDDEPVDPRRAIAPDADEQPGDDAERHADRRSAPASAWRCPTGRTARCRGSSRRPAAPSRQPPKRMAGDGRRRARRRPRTGAAARSRRRRCRSCSPWRAASKASCSGTSRMAASPRVSQVKLTLSQAMNGADPVGERDDGVGRIVDGPGQRCRRPGRGTTTASERDGPDDGHGVHRRGRAPAVRRRRSLMRRASAPVAPGEQIDDRFAA